MATYGTAAGRAPGEAERGTGDAGEVTRADLERAAFAALRHDFHAPSRTHIVWCPGVGRGGTKGFGDAADEAHRAFVARLATLLEAASSGDMRRWWGNLAQDEAERSRERHVRSLAARERMGEYSISLDPSQSAALRAAAGAGAANARIVEALREGLAAVREEARGMTEAAMRDAVAASERLLRDGRRLRGEDLDVRTVRMDAETHARLQLQAHELGVKLPELCRYAVGLHLRRHAHVDPDRDAMGIDPFAGMDRQAFGATARRLGIPRDLLAGFRDRQIELDTVPPAFMARLCDDLPRPVPVAAMRAHLSAEPRLSGAMMFRADGKPAASGRKTFEEAARDAGMPEEEVRRLLSE